MAPVWWIDHSIVFLLIYALLSFFTYFVSTGMFPWGGMGATELFLNCLTEACIAPSFILTLALVALVIRSLLAKRNSEQGAEE